MVNATSSSLRTASSSLGTCVCARTVFAGLWDPGMLGSWDAGMLGSRDPGITGPVIGNFVCSSASLGDSVWWPNGC